MPTVVNLDIFEQQVCSALAANDLDGLRNLLAVQHPADIADVIDRLDDEEQMIVFRLLGPAQAADVLDETSFDATRELIARLPPDEVGDLLDLMPPDDVAEILGEDVPEQQQTLLAAMEPEDAAEVRTLLTYPPRSAGRLMTEKYARVGPDMTATEAIAHLRQIDPTVETLRDLYALDTEERLIGAVSLREVIMAPPEQRLADFMHTQLVTVTPETDQEEVARLVSQYDLLSLPVATPDGRMLGIVTVDDVLDVLVQEGTEDVLRFGAVEGGAGINGVEDFDYMLLLPLRIGRHRRGVLEIQLPDGQRIRAFNRRVPVFRPLGNAAILPQDPPNRARGSREPLGWNVRAVVVVEVV